MQPFRRPAVARQPGALPFQRPGGVLADRIVDHPATISPCTTAAAITPNSGSPATKFRVPSIGSTVNASGASASSSGKRRVGRGGFLADDQGARVAGAQRRGDRPFRRLIRLGHRVEDRGLCRTSPSASALKRGMISVRAGVGEDFGDAGYVGVGKRHRPAPLALGVSVPIILTPEPASAARR